MAKFTHLFDTEFKLNKSETAIAQKQSAALKAGFVAELASMVAEATEGEQDKFEVVVAGGDVFLVAQDEELGAITVQISAVVKRVDFDVQDIVQEDAEKAERAQAVVEAREAEKARREAEKAAKRASR